MKKCAVLLAVVTALCFAGVASAQAYTLHPYTGPLPTHNAAAAWSIVSSRAQVDSGMAAGIARQTGAATFVASDYVAVGYSFGASYGGYNSGISDAGSVGSSQPTPECNSGSQMLKVENTKTLQITEFCTGCGNEWLKVTLTVTPTSHAYVKSIVLAYNKTVSETVLLCKSKFSISVHIHGFIHARTWGSVLGSFHAHLSAAFKAKIKIKAKAIKCFTPPVVVTPPPPAPTPTPTGNCNGNSTNTGTGSAGNCNICTGVSNCNTNTCVNNSCNTTTSPPPTCTNGGTPPSCTPLPPPPAPGTITPNRNQEFFTNTQGNFVCVTTNIPFASITLMSTDYETTSDGGVAQQETSYGQNVWCVTAYNVGNDLPPAWTPPTPPGGTPYPAGNYDTLHWEGVDENGNTVTALGYVNIVKAATNYPT